MSKGAVGAVNEMEVERKLLPKLQITKNGIIKRPVEIVYIIQKPLSSVVGATGFEPATS